MRYVQYYDQTADGRELIEVCGDRGIVILDGRNTLSNSIRDGFTFNGNRRPLYPAFKIMQGESFTRAKPITELVYQNRSHVK
jgi:hypothetical protein